MENYGLNGKVRSFAMENVFTTELNKVCYSLGKQLRPFCLYADEYQKQKGVLDLSTFGGFNNSGVTLFEDIVSERIQSLKTQGVGFMGVTDELKKTLFYQYLMTVSICYVEVEKWHTVNGVNQPTYDKMLVTRNPQIMAAWMGTTVQEMQGKYSRRVSSLSSELEEGVIRFVRLNQSTKGNSISVPRNTFNSKNMKCIPLFMLYAFQEGLFTVLSDSIVEVTFLKDNHTERTIYTTINEGIIRKFYTDQIFIDTMLRGIDIKTVVQGSMKLSSKVHRGYIKVPEIGASQYDSTGTRSINMARISKMRKVDESEVDTTFIDVDLNSVVSNFLDSIDYLGKKSPDLVKDVYKALLGSEAKELPDDTSLATYIELCSNEVLSKESILSTTYLRWLHNFMISNPVYFPLYTGKPTKISNMATNFGVEQLHW